VDAPVIRTALPQRRYRLGDYQATLLGEVESGDDIEYRFILAFVAEGQNKPVLYVCSERNRNPVSGEGSHRIRVINESMAEIVDVSDRWRDLDTFAEQALSIGASMLGMGGESPQRLF
jgi:hypothetical protein